LQELERFSFRVILSESAARIPPNGAATQFDSAKPGFAPLRMTVAARSRNPSEARIKRHGVAFGISDEG